MLKAAFKSLQTFSLPTQTHTHTHTDVEVLTFHCWHVWLVGLKKHWWMLMWSK